MSRIEPLPLLALLLAVFIGAGCANQIEQNVQPLHVADFSSRPTVGVLGKYLGQREVIEGTRAEHAMMPNGITVSTVNGRPLSERVQIEIVGDVQLQSGVTYTLEGYEAGGFIGSPVWAKPDAPQTFGYFPIFVVTRTLQPTTQP
jgi:hypothetical protein